MWLKIIIYLCEKMPTNTDDIFNEIYIYNFKCIAKNNYTDFRFLWLMT